jgi:nitroreductase
MSSTSPEPSALSMRIALDQLELVSQLITSRRTSLLMDREREVDETLLLELCHLITWAPNHKRTWPWLVSIVRHEGRARLGDAAATDAVAEGVSDEARLAKMRGKYLRAPIVLAVGQRPEADEHRRGEDRDAVAAGVQNFLLGAAAIGLATYWGSASSPSGANTLEACGFEPGARISALIYVGWPSSEVPTVEREPLAVGLIDS